MTGRLPVAAVFAVGLACASPGFQKALILPRLDESGVQRVLRNGYDGVELRLHGETTAEAEAARRLAVRSGVKIHSVMADGWYAFDDDSQYASALSQAKSEIALAKAYGVDTLLVVAGARRPAERRYDLPTADELAKLEAATRRAFAELVPLAEQAGVCLSLEFVWNNAWADPDAFASFVRSFGSPWVKVYLDFGNGFKFAPVEKWIAAAGKDIRRVHIKDFLIDMSTPRGGEFVPIATGDIDYKAAFAALKDVGYDGWVSIESGGWDDAQHARLVDWCFAGAPEGDIAGSWTFDLPPREGHAELNDQVGWLVVEKGSVGYLSRCQWRSASPSQVPRTEVRGGAVRIMRLEDGRKSPGECGYDIICGRVVGDEFFAVAQAYDKNGNRLSRCLRFVGRRSVTSAGEFSPGPAKSSKSEEKRKI